MATDDDDDDDDDDIDVTAQGAILLENAHFYVPESFLFFPPRSNLLAP